MATSSLQSNTGSDTIIAGYFQSGDDAHRAINALLDEGFLASQIGAAFHTSGGSGTETIGSAGASEYATGLDTERQELGTTFAEDVARSDNSVGGPASDTSAVTPAGLATGSGSPFLGVGKPGPISGSSLEHTGLPSELKSELGHDKPGSFPPPVASSVPSAHLGSGPAHHTTKADTSWTSKLKHLFQSKHTETTDSAATAESQNFGSGTAHLNLTGPYGRPYSPTAFESSVSGAGVESSHSRHLSHRLSRGGAVVTVSATGRSIEVEKIFERYNGVVRFTSDIFEDSPSLGYEPRVEVFGHLEHRYPTV